LPPALITSPLFVGANAPFSSTSGVLVYPGCVVASITIGAVISGNAASKKITFAPDPGMLKTIVSGPGLAFALIMASRNDPTSLSLTFVTSKVCGVGLTLTATSITPAALASAQTIPATSKTRGMCSDSRIGEGIGLPD